MLKQVKINSRNFLFLFCRTFNLKRSLCFAFLFTLHSQPVKPQNQEAQIISYNVLVGGFSGGIGALINKKKGQKWHKTFVKGFIIGLGGGAIVYSGKKMNALVAQNQNLGYCWLSRAVFSAGNSIVENAAANRNFWSQWHYDIGFVRLEFKPGPFSFKPRFMPSTFGGVVFMAANGTFDYRTTLQSGTITFRTEKLWYVQSGVASTPTNGFLFIDTLATSKQFYDTYAHEMVHAFQFQEFSGFNNFFDPLSDRWKARSKNFEKLSSWIYMDINYELMLGNYLLIQGGVDGGNYCDNFLENEAEFLSVGRSACGL